jgi:mRNA interferase MazF
LSKAYIPSRSDIVWLDFEPTKGKEIGKYRPALVLSSEIYNQQTELLICCPISTSIRGSSTEVPIDSLDQPSVIAASLIQTLSWKDRKAKFITVADPQVVTQVLTRIIPLIGADRIIDQFIV